MALINSIFNKWTEMFGYEDIAFWIARAKRGVDLTIVSLVLFTELGKRVASYLWICMTGVKHIPRLALYGDSRESRHLFFD